MLSSDWPIEIKASEWYRLVTIEICHSYQHAFIRAVVNICLKNKNKIKFHLSDLKFVSCGTVVGLKFNSQKKKIR